jgi:DNA polymerase
MELGNPVFEGLKNVEYAASICTLCELHQGRIKPVFAKGDPRSRFLICGMVPGPEENKEGVPFVGRAGGMLGVILAEVGLPGVYITNFVKCALKPGIPLTQHWIDCCSPFILTQILAIQPKIIITLGADSTNALLGLPLDTKIGSTRGRAHEYFNTHVVPTYHPSYLIRGGGIKHKHYGRVIEDFELAKFIWEDKKDV